MSTNTHGMIPLGDLVVAFDEAARHSSDPNELSWPRRK
jgi:hypothetical protein